MTYAGDHDCLGRVVIDPPPDHWPAPTGQANHAPVYSGHQAQLWHPGILAKDVVARLAAERWQRETRHLVVDQDAHPVWRIDHPRRDGDRLHLRSVLLAPHRAAVPTGYQPPTDPQTIKANLGDLPTPAAQRLADALDHAAERRPHTLAEQVAAVTARLAAAADAAPRRVYATELAAQAAFGELVRDMVDDAERCARAYNAEAARRPAAGLRPLAIGRELVELPLWACRWNEPRRAVFADTSDRRARLSFADGSPLDPSKWDVLPRALTMTAYLRSEQRSAAFIHGLGGGAYDRVTDAWWQRWRRRRDGNPTGELAPILVATADLRLTADVPLADRAEFAAAAWLAHHAPHNVDRLRNLDTPRVRRKRELLQHMDDDRDRARRAAAYREIQRINAELRDAHPDAVRAALRRLADARAGLANADIAARRDWSLPLYEPASLQRLADAIARRTDSTAPHPAPHPTIS